MNIANCPPTQFLSTRLFASVQKTIFFSDDMQRKGTEYTPWYSGQNKFATQAGSGGFLKVRDVLPHTTGGKEIEESLKQKSEGIVPLQSGTNRLASQVGFFRKRCQSSVQRGMTGFGTPRNTQLRSGWKKEWSVSWGLP